MIYTTSNGKSVHIVYNKKNNMYTGEFIGYKNFPKIYGDTITENEEQAEETEHELCRDQTS